jgi:hypothetical protein
MVHKTKRYFVMFEGKELGTVNAKSWKEAKEKAFDEVITLEQEEEEG